MSSPDSPAPHLWPPLSLQQERSRKLKYKPSFDILFYCATDVWCRVRWGGHERGKGKRRGKALSGFTLQISQPSSTHLLGLEAWLNGSISPQRAVNHTLSNAERWLQAPLAFIINHWDRKDTSLHLQSHRSSNYGHILPKNDFPDFSTACGLLGPSPEELFPGAVFASPGRVFLTWSLYQDILKCRHFPASLETVSACKHPSMPPPAMSYGVFTGLHYNTFYLLLTNRF